jgi:hypothetical protein
MDAALITVMQIHLTEPEGDILLFLTGQEEIDTAAQVGCSALVALGLPVVRRRAAAAAVGGVGPHVAGPLVGEGCLLASRCPRPPSAPADLDRPLQRTLVPQPHILTPRSFFPPTPCPPLPPLCRRSCLSA